MNRRDRTVQPHRSTALRMLLMLIVVGAVFGAIFGLKWYGSKMMNQAMDNMPMPPASISAAVVRQEQWGDSLGAVGSLAAVNGTRVTTEAAGVVSAIRFESGQQVARGEVLLQLEASTELASLRALEAGLRLAVTQRDRFRELYEERKLVARADLDQRESEVEQLQAQVEAQRALIARKTIRAPFAGRLGIRRVNLGQYLNPGDAIVSLQSLDPIHLDFSVPEQRLADIRTGLPVSAQVDAAPGRSFEGTVTAIEPEVDVATRNVRVQATLANPDGLLRPGTSARVAAGLGEPRTVVVIPQTAVSFNPYGNSVYVIGSSQVASAGGDSDVAGPGQASPPVQVEGDTLTVSQRFIRTGASRGDLVAVLEGLRPGERVATSGLLKLRNGATVVINDRVEPTAEADPAPDNR
ncbi:MAG: efflux RND transporter periplasmic adaptor subunit [Xanthomonadales bacterium]|nr:efflux RND transporter periplasmic adaptor subunit [Xanthomonadales bacterium]